jgi:hypothetical protein
VKASRVKRFATLLPPDEPVLSCCVAGVARLDTASKIKLDQHQLEVVAAETLKGHPALARVERVSIVRLYGGQPNWDVATIVPELSSGQYLIVREIVSGLRLIYCLRDESI